MDRSVSVIFDVDGTLWDTSEIVASSWSRAVKENLPAYFVADRMLTDVSEKIWGAYRASKGTAPCNAG